MCATVASVTLSRAGGVRGIVSWKRKFTTNGPLLAVVILLGYVQPAFLQFSPCNGKTNHMRLSYSGQRKLART